MGLRGKKLLISTPIFGGTIATQYFASFMGMLPYLVREGIGFEIITEARNLIHQCRNRAAHYALNGKFDKLLFIDADISWKPSDVLNLMESDQKVIGGLYPFKTFPMKLNFVPKQGIYPPEVKTFDVQQYVDDFADKKTNLVEVHMLPTGFMMVDTSVFRELEPIVDKYNHRDQFMLNLEYEKMFFPFKIADDGFLYTEDWSFCDLVRNKLGHKIYWHTKVIVDHIGTHQFSAWTPLEKSYKHVNIHEKQEDKSLVPNPFKKWGRNLQCFCGSGLKFKKCCESLLNDVKPDEALLLQPDFDRLHAEVEADHDRGVGYKLKETVYDQVETSD